MEELAGLLEGHDADPGIRCIVIAGSDEVFAAGSKRRWLEEAMELAQTVARRPPIAARLAKQAVNAADETGLAAGLEAERHLYELSMATEDRVEGMEAFIEKRKPDFKGR